VPLPWRRCVATAAGAALLLATAAFVVAPTELSPASTRLLATLALQWAVSGGIADFKLVKDPSHLVVSSAQLPKRTQLALPGRNVAVLSPRRIQQRADRQGDFLYFRFERFRRHGTRASVALALLWAVSVHSTAHYLSGGGAVLTFEQCDGTWHLLPVRKRWMSHAAERRLSVGVAAGLTSAVRSSVR
jgi:hypothetical protein